MNISDFLYNLNSFGYPSHKTKHLLQQYLGDSLRYTLGAMVLVRISHISTFVVF